MFVVVVFVADVDAMVVYAGARIVGRGLCCLCC